MDFTLTIHKCISIKGLAAIAIAAGSVLRAGDGCSSPLFQRATESLSQRNFDQAGLILDQASACPGLSAMETFQLGWLYGRSRHFEKALQAFSHVPADIPDRATHAYAVALSQFELGDYRGVVQGLQKLRSTQQLDGKAGNLLAVAYSKLTAYKDALAVLEDQLQRSPDDLPTYLNIITVCAEGGDYASAAKYASQASARFPKSAEVLISRGAANSLLGKPADAAQDFSTAASVAPERADARFFLALTNYNQGQYAQAIGTLKNAIRDGLKDPDLHYLLAECLLKSGTSNSQEAFNEVTEALTLDPDSVPAKILRGRLLLDTGHAKEALSDLELAHRSDPSSRSAVYNLARAYRAAGETKQAATLFQQLRSAQPDAVKEAGDRRLNQTLSSGGARQ
jgi:tetratricopeptide (TPR) repeat protein